MYPKDEKRDEESQLIFLITQENAPIVWGIFLMHIFGDNFYEKYVKLSILNVELDFSAVLLPSDSLKILLKN